MDMTGPSPHDACGLSVGPLEFRTHRVPSDERNDAWRRFGTVLNLARIAPDVDIDVNFYGPTLVPCHVPEARSTFPRLGRSLRLALSPGSEPKKRHWPLLRPDYLMRVPGRAVPQHLCGFIRCGNTGS
jgi:hypothetical protein